MSRPAFLPPRRGIPPPRACLAALAVLAAAPDARAQPSIEWVTPTARGGGGPVIVLLKNGDKPVQNVAISWLSRAGEVHPFGGGPVAALPAGGETVVNGTAPPQLAVAAGDSLLLRVDFDVAAARQSRFAWLAVGRRLGPPPLQVTVLGAAQSLVDYETRRILLQLTDTGAVPLQVGAVRTRQPRFIDVRPATPGDGPAEWPLQLAPGETRVVAYDVRLAGGITPGQQTLVFDVPVTWRAGGEAATANVLASTTLNAAVLGESELLKVLALPSILFVPGFLILVTLGLLWRTEALAHWHPRLTLPSSPTQPEFWVLSITASMGVWGAVNLLWKRNLLAGYNARDVARVWMYSMGAGVLIFVLVAVAYYVGLRWWRSPMRVLNSLAEEKRTIVLPRVRFTVGDREQTGFLLRDDDPASPTVLVAPPLRIQWDRGVSEEVRSEYEAGLTARELKAADVARLLKGARKRKHAKVFWKQSRALAWPIAITRGDFTEDGKDLLLQVEPAVPRPRSAPPPPAAAPAAGAAAPAVAGAAGRPA